MDIGELIHSPITLAQRQLVTVTAVAPTTAFSHIAKCSIVNHRAAALSRLVLGDHVEGLRSGLWRSHGAVESWRIYIYISLYEYIYID